MVVFDFTTLGSKLICFVMISQSQGLSEGLYFDAQGQRQARIFI